MAMVLVIGIGDPEVVCCQELEAMVHAIGHVDVHVHAARSKQGWVELLYV
ncbi:hypothetical protein CRG98_048694, partial [Punica granatum]